MAHQHDRPEGEDHPHPRVRRAGGLQQLLLRIRTPGHIASSPKASMDAPDSAEARLSASGAYWRGIFSRNPEFCSWQSPRQSRVREAVCACLNGMPGTLRTLDFGIGSLGLYRALDDTLMRRLSLTGISESQQHSAADPLLDRYPVRIAVGPGLSPLRGIADQSQDLVLCTYVFAYLDARMRRDALAAFARLLVPGGRLVLVLHHPRGERARKFHASEPYWPSVRLLYERLLTGRFAEARVQLHALTAYLAESFEADEIYPRYLASYLKTATRFLATFCAHTPDARLVCAVHEEALRDCRDMLHLIDREWSMTCRAFNPITDPAQELEPPTALRLSDVAELVDPTCGAPIANLVTMAAR